MEWVFVAIIGLLIFMPDKDRSTDAAVIICVASQCTLQVSEVDEEQVLSNSSSGLSIDTESKSQEDLHIDGL